MVLVTDGIEAEPLIANANAILRVLDENMVSMYEIVNCTTIWNRRGRQADNLCIYRLDSSKYCVDNHNCGSWGKKKSIS